MKAGITPDRKITTLVPAIMLQEKMRAAAEGKRLFSTRSPCFFVFPVPATCISNNQGRSYSHSTDRRQDHEKNRPINRALTFFGSRLRIGPAHGAALCERRCGPERQHQQSDQRSFSSQAHVSAPRGE